VNLPPSHCSHAAALAPLYSPGLQLAHAVPPAASWCRPASHASQYVEPVAGWFLPASHRAHDVCAVDGWYVPATHTSHVALPLWLWYSPLAHCEHAAAPAALDRPTVQFVHRTEPSASSLCCPAAHTPHDDCAFSAVNWPPPHCVQPAALAPL